MDTSAPAEPAPSTGTSAPEPSPEPALDPVDEAVPELDVAPEPEAAVEAADPGITVKVDGGPYLVGQTIPVEITVTNHGSATSTGVRAYNTPVSGSYLSINSYGELSNPSGATIPAGEELVVVAEARVHNWQGSPVARFSIYSSNDSSYDNNNFEIAVPVTAPDAGRGSLGGLVYGDANGNNAPDAGEGLPGVQVSLSSGGTTVRGATGADGRYEIDDLLLQNYGVYLGDAPDGWVLPSYSTVDVDGAEHLDFRGTRPLSDQLEASMSFTEDTYEVGQTAEITVVLTNKGDTDVTGVKAGCDRSGGEGPHVVSMVLGDLAWNAAGVTVGAGRSRTLTITGVVPAKAADYAVVQAACDFGPGDGPVGYPAAQALARVPGAGPGDTWGVLYHDRDEDQIADADEFLEGVDVAAVDRVTGQVVARTSTDAGGRLEFTGLPAGLYELRIFGPWKVRYGQAGFAIGSCVHCGGGWYVNVVPGPDVPDVPDTDPTPVPPTTDSPTTPPSSTAPPAAAGGGGGSTGGGLATTGASTAGLTAFGLLSLVAGFGAVAATRRRRAA